MMNMNQNELQSQEEIDTLIDSFDNDYYQKCQSKKIDIFFYTDMKNKEPLQSYKRELKKKILVRQAQRKKELTKEYKLKGKKPWKADYFNANKEVEDSMNEESNEYIKELEELCIINRDKELESNVEFRYYKSLTSI